MCLSVPAKLIEKQETMGKADVDGNLVEVNLMMLDDVKVGDYVLIHAGFAIQRYEEDEALETLAMLREALGADTEAL